MHISHLPLALCLLAGACSTPQTPPPQFLPLTPLASHAVTYAGRLSPTGLDLRTEAPRDLPGEDLPRVAVSCQVYELDRELVPSLIASDLPWLRADSVPRAEAEELFARLTAGDAAAVVTRAKLLQHAGRPGSLAITNQTAYVESFELQSNGALFLADPHIAVSREGLWMDVNITDRGGSPGDEECNLDLELRLAELQRPITRATGRVPGMPDEMSLQLPLFATQTLETSARIRGDEALLVGPLPGFDGERALVFLLTVETLPQPIAALE